jgi:hypothetical protein
MLVFIKSKKQSNDILWNFHFFDNYFVKLLFLRGFSKKLNQKFFSFENFQKDWNPSFSKLGSSKISKIGTKGYIYV